MLVKLILFARKIEYDLKIILFARFLNWVGRWSTPSHPGVHGVMLKLIKFKCRRVRLQVYLHSEILISKEVEIAWGGHLAPGVHPNALRSQEGKSIR